jgi:hypothetical protein
VDKMLEDHVAALGNSLAALRATVELVLHHIAPEAIGSPRIAAPEGSTPFEHLFESVRRVDQTLRYLLAGESETSLKGHPNAAIQDLGHDLRATGRALQAFDDQRRVAVSKESGIR